MPRRNEGRWRLEMKAVVSRWFALVEALLVIPLFGEFRKNMTDGV